MRFLALVLILCGISFSGERWDYSGSLPKKVYTEDVDTITQSEETHTNTTTERQIRVMEEIAQSVKTMANIMTGCLLVGIGLVIFSAASF